jgi:hypothetical protein
MTLGGKALLRLRILVYGAVERGNKFRALDFKELKVLLN